jgi:hypothetical protein
MKIADPWKGMRQLGAKAMGGWVAGLLLWSMVPVQAQIDPENRRLLQIGYNQPLEGRGPMAAYAYYYYNRPHFYQSNTTLRLAVAPTYLDSQLGFVDALGAGTDVGLGVAGGGFADSYSEVRMGQLRRDESFVGHGGEVNGAIYHRLNPNHQIPLSLIARGAIRFSAYEADSDTSPSFEVPEDRGTFLIRTGVRWGGREPLMLPSMAMELSAWYEGQFRTSPGEYGFNGDRAVESTTHLAWARGLLAYTFPEWHHYLSVSMTLGTSLHADRLSAYRIGGSLPLIAEFPLSLPGYYFQELTARRFALFSGVYSIPVDPDGHWEVMGYAATALVGHLRGLDQPGDWHSGVGGALVFRPGSKALHIMLGYGYGIEARRGNERGAHNVGFLLQYDFEQGGPLLPHGINPMKWRGIDRMLGR